MTEQLNYIGQAINLVRRATGTCTSPGETCEHIRFTNPDRELKDGRLKLFEPWQVITNNVAFWQV